MVFQEYSKLITSGLLVLFSCIVFGQTSSIEESSELAFFNSMIAKKLGELGFLFEDHPEAKLLFEKFSKSPKNSIKV